MNLIGYMPDGTARDGVTDDRAALQAMFDKIDHGSRVFIPDGHYRINGKLGIRKRCWIACSAGAHLDFHMSGSADRCIEWQAWNSVQKGDRNALAQQLSRWEGGVISRDNNLGPAFFADTCLLFHLEDLVVYGGSPCVQITCTRGTIGRWSAMVAITNVRTEGGGKYGIWVGAVSGSETNRSNVVNVHCDGPGGTASIGQYFCRGASANVAAAVFRNYAIGAGRAKPCRDSIALAVRAPDGSKAFDLYGSSGANDHRTGLYLGDNPIGRGEITAGEAAEFGPGGFKHMDNTQTSSEPT